MLEGSESKVIEGIFQSLDPALLTKIVALQTEIVESGIDKPVVMQRIADAALDLTDADGALVEAIEGDEMVYAAVAPKAIQSTKGLRLKIGSSLSGLCVRENQILECVDSELDPRVDRDACRRVGLRAMTLVPLAAGNSVVGVLKVFTKSPGSLGNEKLSALKLLARLLGAAM